MSESVSSTSVNDACKNISFLSPLLAPYYPVYYQGVTYWVSQYKLSSQIFNFGFFCLHS